jgi:uncharacterized protein (DUF433 family)
VVTAGHEDRITADPKILGGKPVVRGTRIAVSLVLEERADELAAGKFVVVTPGNIRVAVKPRS